jgi:hypothetical protein
MKQSCIPSLAISSNAPQLPSVCYLTAAAAAAADSFPSAAAAAAALPQSLKDGIVVMSMGADALPFLTTLGSLPASLAFFNFYKTVLVGALRCSC